MQFGLFPGLPEDVREGDQGGISIGAVDGPWRRICGLPVLWVALLYDGGSLDAAGTL